MAIHDFKSQRLLVDHDLTGNTVLEATREQANYLLNVLRLGEGQSILVFNGRDGEWSAKIEPKGRKKCNLVVSTQTRRQPGKPSLVYCFAPLKQARLDYMIQKSVEMGVGVLQPVITEYTQVRTLNLKRVHANVGEAAEQCGILSLPEVRDPVPLSKLSGVLGSDCQIVFCDEADSQHNGLTQLKDHKSKPVAVLVGPEGGFSEDERKLVQSHGKVISLGLGPRILRADTAAVAAMALVQANAGDWYDG